MTALRQERSFIDNHHLRSNYFRTCDQGVESPLDDGNESSDDFRCTPDSGHRRPARPCRKKVESRMGAVAWAIRQRSVSHPRSSNRTCPIKASGSPTGFTVRHTAGPLGSAFETQQTVLSIDNVEREAVCATSCHFVPSGEEVAYALINVSVDAAECRSARPMAEVVRPAKQRAVQRVEHFGPWIVVARHQQ